MWISRRKYEDLEDRIALLEEHFGGQIVNVCHPGLVHSGVAVSLKEIVMLLIEHLGLRIVRAPTTPQPLIEIEILKTPSRKRNEPSSSRS